LLGTLEQPDFGKRFGAMALRNYIDGGCTGSNDAPDPRLAVWAAMKAQLALGTAAGINGAKQYMTDTAIANYAPAFVAVMGDLPAVVASYSPIIARQITADYAEYWVSRPVGASTIGARSVYIITFLRTQDGTWRVDAL
jgi:hypothetical protein